METENAYIHLVQKPVGKQQLGRPEEGGWWVGTDFGMEIETAQLAKQECIQQPRF
jgi:hypothetical protein